MAKKNLFKSLGLSFTTEDVFNQAITDCGKIVRKKSVIEVVKDDTGSYVKSGPICFWVRKDGRFACQDGYLRKPVFADEKTVHFKLFNNSKPYQYKLNDFCLKLFREKLDEISGVSVAPRYNGKDNVKLKHISLMLVKLIAPPKKSPADWMRIMMHYVWDLLDKETLDIAINTIGYGATSFDFSLIGENLEEIRGIYKTTPGVLPVWIAKKYREYYRDKGNDLVLRTDEDLFLPDKDTSSFSYKTNSVVADAKADLADMKAGSNKVWKYICKLKPRWSRSLATKGQTYARGEMYKLLADVSDLPKYTVLRDIAVQGYSICQDGIDRIAGVAENERRNVNHETRVAFLRAAFKASLKKPAKTFWQNEASLVWDWISREFVCLDANQQRASWDWFMMKQAEWHRDFQERLRIQRERYDAERKAREAARKHKWESLIEPFERNGYTVTPLLTTEELTEEGKEMHHCVAGYSASCEDGLSRIFSIKQGEKRVSTLELVKNRYDAREGFNWSISQHRGPTNLAVTEELDKLAQHIKSRYNKAYDKWEKEQAENKQLESKEKVEVEVAPVVEAPRQLELLNDVF